VGHGRRVHKLTPREIILILRACAEYLVKAAGLPRALARPRNDSAGQLRDRLALPLLTP
jgi:hypothetical protein